MKKYLKNHAAGVRSRGKSGAAGREAEGQMMMADLRKEYRTLVEAQTDLEFSRQRFADLFDFAPIGYLTLSRSGVIEEINLTGCRLLQTTRERAIGRPLLLEIEAADRRKYLRHLAKCRRRNTESRVELSLVRKDDGPVVIVELLSLPLATGEEYPQFKTALLDITARRQAEEGLRQAHGELENRVAERTEELTRANSALLKSEKNLSDFFDQSPLGLMWVGRDGAILRVNQTQLELLGLGPADCVGQSVKKFMPDAKAAQEALHRLARRETLQNYRAVFRHVDGTLRHVLADANGLWEQGRLVHSRWFVRDVTYRMNLEKEILAISERVQERIGQDLHDGVCQQLTGIKFRARLLEQKLAKRGIRDSRGAHEIETLLNQAIEQTRGQARGLNPVRLETGGLPMALRELAASVTDLFPVRCTCYVSKQARVPDLEAAIHFYRIAQEAISNAIKHGRAKKVDVQLEGRDGLVRLIVADNGIGFPSVKKPASGMGLHIMSYRARTIGATVEVRNGPSGGALVTCTLPINAL